MFLLLCMYALFAAEFPLAKFALRETNAFFLETMRMMIGGSLLLGYYFLRKGSFFIPRKDWVLFAKLILFYIYLSYFAGSWSLQYMSSLKANILYSLMPFASAGLNYVLFRDRPHKNKILGMCIGAGGLLLMLFTTESAGASLRESLHVSVPEVVMLVSIFATEYGYFLLKQLYEKGYPLVLVNGIAMAVGSLLSLSSGLLLFDQRVMQYTSLPLVIGYAAALFALVNIVDIYLYAKLIKKYSVTFLTFAGFLSPIFGVLYGTLFMGETLSVIHLVSFSLIFLGLYLFSSYDTVPQKALETS